MPKNTHQNNQKNTVIYSSNIRQPEQQYEGMLLRLLANIQMEHIEELYLTSRVVIEEEKENKGLQLTEQDSLPLLEIPDTIDTMLSAAQQHSVTLQNLGQCELPLETDISQMATSLRETKEPPATIVNPQPMFTMTLDALIDIKPEGF